MAFSGSATEQRTRVATTRSTLPPGRGMASARPGSRVRARPRFLASSLRRGWKKGLGSEGQVRHPLGQVGQIGSGPGTDLQNPFRPRPPKGLPKKGPLPFRHQRLVPGGKAGVKVGKKTFSPKHASTILRPR